MRDMVEIPADLWELLQNPWKEIDLHRLRDLDIPFVRRKSGGGTVYHVR